MTEIVLVSSLQPNETPMPVHRQAVRKKGRFNCCRRTTTLRRSSGGGGWFKVVWIDQVFEMLFRMVQPKLHIL